MDSGPGQEHRDADDEATIRAAYRAATREGLQAAAPPAFAGLVIFGLAAGTIELLYFPERWRALLALNLAYMVCGLVHQRFIRRRPRWTVASTLVASWGMYAAVITYFATVRGSAELCLIIVSALLTSQVIIHPWNAAGQAIAAIVPVIAFSMGLQLGLEAHLPLIFPLFSLLTMAMLTTLGAERLDRHRFEAFRRALLLQRVAEEQSEERALLEALLDIARAMNIAISDPRHLANELAEHTRHALGVDWVLVHRWIDDSERYLITAAAGAPADLADELIALGTTDSWSSRLDPVLSAQGAVEVRRADPTGPFPAILFDRWGIRSARIQSVTREQRRVGIITCVRLSSDQPFSEAQRRMLAAIATQAAVALENASLGETSRAAERLKGEFVATVSHELRTPLNVILGYTDLILEGNFGDRPEAETEALKSVRHQSHQLLDMIQGLLDINRLEARGAALTLRRFPVAEVITSLQQNIPESWLRSSVRLCWEPVASPAVVRSDFAKLETILRNLIHNGLKFTEHGTVTVRVEVLPATATVQFIVSDTGRGISATDVPVIFEMFGQGQAGPRAGGVGLGLYIVKRLADIMGGTIDVVSAPGQGSRFTFALPAEFQ